MCGAAEKSTTVAMRVKRVKVRRQTRSSTIAAYFQSFTADTALIFRYCSNYSINVEIGDL